MINHQSHPLIRQLADYVVRERASELSPEIIHHAKRAVIDWYAAVLAGSVCPPTKLLERALSDELDTGRAALAWGRPATIRAAALINGTASHAAEVDDVFRDAVFHPGSPTIAAALAIAYAYRRSGEEFLRAVIAGYEISTRIAATVFKAHYRFWHPTGTVGGFGAAAASAVLLRLSPEQTMHALATAATLGAGLQQAFRSEAMSKPLHAGRAADNGVMSALAAQQDVTGALDILEGASGFGAAMGGGPDWATAIAGLGAEYNIARITIKNHCCCGQAFAAIDAALALRALHQFSLDDVRYITIATYETALRVAGSYDNRGPSEARFSIPYLVAHALVHGSVRLDAATDAARNDPVVAALMRRIELQQNQEFDLLFPTQRCASIKVEFSDERVLQHTQRTRKGDPDDPLTDDELVKKYFELVEPMLGESAATSLLDSLWSIDGVPDIAVLGKRVHGGIGVDSAHSARAENTQRERLPKQVHERI